MPETHDLGPKYYWHYMKQEKSAPLFQRSITQEIEHPFRKGAAKVFRIPLTQHSLVFGAWTGVLPETDALMAALWAHETDYEGW